MVTVDGSGKVSAFIHSLSDLLVIDVETDEAETSELKWYAYPQVAEALLVDDGRPNIDQYFPEITCFDEEIDGIKVYYQQYNHSADGCAASHWIKKGVKKDISVLFSRDAARKLENVLSGFSKKQRQKIFPCCKGNMKIGGTTIFQSP